jgi:hypothetical protein
VGRFNFLKADSFGQAVLIFAFMRVLHGGVSKKIHCGAI